MLSYDVYVENLCQLMGEDEANYGINWTEETVAFMSSSHLKATVDDDMLILSGSPEERIFLKVFRGDEIETIQEPTIHLSRSPFGQFFLWLTSGAWPKGPTTPQERANERLRVALNNLCIRAHRQQEMRLTR